MDVNQSSFSPFGLQWRGPINAFWDVLRQNISIWFAPIAYFHLAYYDSDLFPWRIILQLSERQWPVQLLGGTPEIPRRSDLLFGMPTMIFLIAAASAHAFPNQNISESFQGLLRDNWAWACEDWGSYEPLAAGWPLFGSLATLRDTMRGIASGGFVYNVDPGGLQNMCMGLTQAEYFFEIALFAAALKDTTVPLELTKAMLAGKGSDQQTVQCQLHRKLLRAAAHFSAADDLRLAAARRAGNNPRQHVEDPAAIFHLRQGQLLLISCFLKCVPNDLMDLDALFKIPSWIWWLLDRLQCSPWAEVQTRWKLWENEDAGMARGTMTVSYMAAIFPHRERVSDILRIRSKPYCSDEVLVATEKLARKATVQSWSSARFVEIGANLGDCAISAALRLARVPSLAAGRARGLLQVFAFEAVPDTAELLAMTTTANSLDDIIQVLRFAIVAPATPGEAARGARTTRVTSRSRGSNSFTAGPRAGAADWQDAQTMHSKSVDVPTVTLENVLFRQRHCDRPCRVDALVVHVGGAELDVLRGSWRLLSRLNGVRKILVQVFSSNNPHVDDPNYDAGEVVAWLTRRGYRVTTFAGRGGSRRQLLSGASVKRYLMHIQGKSKETTTHLEASPRWYLYRPVQGN